MSQWAKASKCVKLLSPISAAATANATSAWTDITDAEGDIIFTVSAGALTGAIVWTVEHATASDGTGGAAFTCDDGAFSAVTANTCQKRTVSATALNAFVRVVGTITTGPVLVSATATYVPDEPA